MRADTFPPAPRRADDGAPDRVTAHLLKAEREVRWLRTVGMLGWLLVLYRKGFAFGLTPVWTIYVLGAVYTAWAHWRAQVPHNIRRVAVVTTVSDSLLAAAMCLVTGGVESVFFPFLSFTLLAAAFRFGVLRSLVVTGLNFGLTVVLYCAAPAPRPAFDVLVIALCYLAFSAVLGAMLAGWARENINLVLAQASVLREARDRSRALLHRLIDAQEDERKTISGELHDRMSGRLFSLQQGLDRCALESADRPALQRQLGELAGEVRECTGDVRSIMNELRPTVLDELGFYEAVGEYLANLAEVVPFQLKVQIDPALRTWRSRQDAMLFRLLQEALLNIRKHAAARKVEIRFGSDGDDIVLSIADDGRGFDPAGVPVGHYGLLTMRERAEALGGSLKLDSAPDKGTRLTVTLPR